MKSYKFFNFRITFVLAVATIILFVPKIGLTAFQYTNDRFIGTDITPRAAWYLNGDKNCVCVRSMGGNNMAMFIAKNSVQVMPNKHNILTLTGDVYQLNRNTYIKNTYVYIYAINDAGNPVAYGGLADKVIKNAKQQGLEPFKVDPYGSWQGKGEARIAEMFYYIATGKKFFGRISINQLPNTVEYRQAKVKQSTVEYDVILTYWYSQDVYDRCDGK